MKRLETCATQLEAVVTLRLLSLLKLPILVTLLHTLESLTALLYFFSIFTAHISVSSNLRKPTGAWGSSGSTLLCSTDPHNNLLQCSFQGRVGGEGQGDAGVSDGDETHTNLEQLLLRENITNPLQLRLQGRVLRPRRSGC